MQFLISLLQKRASEQNDLQHAEIATAIRLVKEGQMTFEEVSQYPPDGISRARWSAMLRREINDL